MASLAGFAAVARAGLPICVLAGTVQIDLGGRQMVVELQMQ